MILLTRPLLLIEGRISPWGPTFFSFCFSNKGLLTLSPSPHRANQTQTSETNASCSFFTNPCFRTSSPYLSCLTKNTELFPFCTPYKPSKVRPFCPCKPYKNKNSRLFHFCIPYKPSKVRLFDPCKPYKNENGRLFHMRHSCSTKNAEYFSCC